MEIDEAKLVTHLKELTTLYETLLEARLDTEVREGERAPERDTVLYQFGSLFCRVTQLWSDVRVTPWWPADANLLLRQGRKALPILSVAYGRWTFDHPDAPTPEEYTAFLKRRELPPGKDFN